MRRMRSSCSGSRARLALALVAGTAAAGLGCTTACDTSDDKDPPEVYTAGIGDPVTQVYETSPYTSGLLNFPGGKQYFLVHHLGFTPATVQFFIGFTVTGE